MVDCADFFRKAGGPVTSPWTVLGESLNGYIRTEILTASCELGLFTYLEKTGSATAGRIAADLGISEHGARILLLGCCEAGLTEREVQVTIPGATEPIERRRGLERPGPHRGHVLEQFIAA